jgi:lysozyme
MKQVAAVAARVFTYRKKMKISKTGIDLIKHFEGCELEAYKCAAGVPTIGYGHIKGVTMGDTITQDEAEAMLVHELLEYENYIHDCIDVQLSQNQFDAMVSWVFNLGVGNLRSSTLRTVLNQGDYEGVPAQIMRWNKAGGKVLEGLTRRRQAEADLFSAN